MQNLSQAHDAICEFNKILLAEIKKEAETITGVYCEMGATSHYAMTVTCFANFAGMKSTLKVDAVIYSNSLDSPYVDKALAVKLANYVRGALNETN